MTAQHFRPLVALLLLLGCTRTAPCTSPETQPTVQSSDHASQPPEAGEPSSPAANGTDEPLDPPEAQAERKRLVDRIELLEKPWGDPRWDADVIAQLRRVPRHLFMPKASIYRAYRDSPQPIGYGQTISQPTVVALMTNALHLDGSEQVLEIGTGSGYQAAVLSGLCKAVYSIEIVEPLGEAAAARLERLGYDNVHVRIGDGYRGWPEQAPFDRVILTAAPPKMPQALVDQLRVGGILVAPVGEDFQVLVRWTKRADGMHEERLGGVRFVPMVPGSER